MGDAQHIISNQAECRMCGEVIYSSYRHDHVTCRCGSISVDGGNDYLRHGWQQEGDLIDQSLTMDLDDFTAIYDYTKEMYKSRNARGILYGVMRAIRDQGYELVKKEETNGDK